MVPLEGNLPEAVTSWVRVNVTPTASTTDARGHRIHGQRKRMRQSRRSASAGAVGGQPPRAAQPKRPSYRQCLLDLMLPVDKIACWTYRAERPATVLDFMQSTRGTASSPGFRPVDAAEGMVDAFRRRLRAIRRLLEHSLLPPAGQFLNAPPDSFRGG